MASDKRSIKQDAVFLLRAAGKSWKDIQIATDLSYQTVRRYFKLAIDEQSGTNPEKHSDKQAQNPLVTQQISIDELL